MFPSIPGHLAVALLLPLVPTAPVDRYGDPLPPGAVARLGTTRLRHGADVTAVAFLPDGKGLLTAGRDCKVLLWDAKTGKRLREVADLSGHAEDMAVTADGKTIAIASKGEVSLWDVGTGTKVKELACRGALKSAVAVSPDGRVVAAAGSRGVEFWDRTTGRPLRHIKREVERGPAGLPRLPSSAEARRRGAERAGPYLSFSADGKSLLSSDDGVFLWDAPTGAELLRLVGPDDESDLARAACFAPDGQTFVVARSDRRGFAIRDARTWQELRCVESDVKVNGLAVSPDGKCVAAADREGGITFWDAATGRRRGRVPPSGSSGPAALTFAPDGRLLAAAYGRTVRLWDTTTGKEVGPAAGHRGKVSAVACSPDGKVIATGGDDGTLRLWDRASSAELHCLRGHAGRVWAAAFAPDGKALASGGADGTLRLWDAATGKELRRYFEADETSLYTVAFAPDGKSLAAGKGGSAVVWDLRTGKERRRFTPGGSIDSLAWSPDGKTLVACPGDQRVHRWDVTTGEELAAPANDDKCVVGAAFSPDGSLIASAGWAGGARLWNVATGRMVRQLAEDRSIAYSVASSPDGRLAPGTPIAYSVAFSPDGRTLAVRYLDRGIVTLFETATGAERGRIEGHDGYAFAFAFTPDGREVVTAGHDMTALVWKLFTPPGRRARPRAADLEALWQALGGEEPRTAFNALTALTASPRAAALLAKKLQPVERSSPERLARLLADLDSDDFGTRERATAELAALDSQAKPALRRALAGPSPAETRRRAEELLGHLESAEASPWRLRQGRALEALERMDDPAAWALLEALAKGAPGVPLTREAKAALTRGGRH